VDQRHLSAGEAAYAAGDWQSAALEFIAAAQGGPAEGAGHVLHQAGNALMKLHRYADAVTVYRKAAGDPAYEKRGAVFANLGAALAGQGQYEGALDAYDGALTEVGYATPYKAILGRAAALYALGRFEEATQEYRQAAWADGNPDPGKALNNLGLSFMALGRPEDAVEAFKAAVGVEGYATKGKAAGNLALAYTAMGFFEEAVREFETARDTYGFELTDAMLETYEAAVARAHNEEQGPADGGELPDGASAAEAGERGSEAHASGSTGAFPALHDANDEATQRFFTITEDEMRDADRKARRAERAEKRTPRAIALRVGELVLVVLVVFGGLAAAFYGGYGYPTQEQAVTGLLNAYRAGSSYSDFWVAVPVADVAQEMRSLPAKFASFQIQGVDRASRASTVAVTVSLDSGGRLGYDVQLAREGVGWKVVGIQNAWSSTAK
jgi:tetratricopeptide (TPR) repeat protein